MNVDSEIKKLAGKKLSKKQFQKFLYSYERGKRVRPTFMRLVCEKIGKSFKPLKEAATAAEIVHCASLMHDDVIDRSEKRRGRNAFHKKYSTTQAILYGDLFSAAANQILLEKNYPLRLLREFAECTKKMAEAQITEAENKINSKKTYLEYVEKKTAGLFLFCAQAPLTYWGKKNKKILFFAENFGKVFQLADDLSEKKPEKNNILSFASKKEAEKILAQKLGELKKLKVFPLEKLALNYEAKK